jgi:hypothetical protein
MFVCCEIASPVQVAALPGTTAFRLSWTGSSQLVGMCFAVRHERNFSQIFMYY